MTDIKKLLTETVKTFEDDQKKIEEGLKKELVITPPTKDNDKVTEDKKKEGN